MTASDLEQLFDRREVRVHGKLMHRIQDWLGLYFAGTYFHTLDKNNGGQLEYSLRFVLLSIYIIVLANLMFAAGLTFTFFGPDTIFESKLAIVLILIGLFLLCWIYFVWHDRYKDLVRPWVDSRARAKRIGMGVNWFLFGSFALMIIRIIIVT